MGGDENRDLSEAELEALRRLAQSKPRSEGGKQAKMNAIDILNRVDQDGLSDSLPPMPPGWRPITGAPLDGLDESHFAAHPELLPPMWRAYWKTGSPIP